MMRVASEVHFHASDDRNAGEMVAYLVTGERLRLFIPVAVARAAAEDFRMVAEAPLGAIDPARDAA